MRLVVIGLISSLAFGGPSLAERAHGEHCTKVSDLKAKLKANDKLEVLNPGAFHLAEGLWMAVPPLSAEIPDVDGAVIITIENESSLVFTHGKDNCVAQIPPFRLPPQWVRALSAAKTSDGETADPKDELHL